MSKLPSVVVSLAVGLVALAAAGPALARLAGALVPLVLVSGVVAAVLRVLWSYTRRE